MFTLFVLVASVGLGCSVFACTPTGSILLTLDVSACFGCYT